MTRYGPSSTRWEFDSHPGHDVSSGAVTPKCEALLELATAMVTKSPDRTRIKRDGSEPTSVFATGHVGWWLTGTTVSSILVPRCPCLCEPTSPEQFAAPHPSGEVQVLERAVAVPADPFEEVPDLFRAPELKIRTRSSRKGDSDRDVL